MNSTSRPLYTRISKLRRRYRPENRIARGIIDAGPLVDVALLVFLFFLVNSAFVLQPGIIVNLPESAFVAGTQYGSMVVTISQEGLIFFNDERTTMEGLGLSFAQAVHEDPNAPLIIEADGRVRHRALVDVYNMAMDAGIKEIALGTRISSARPAK